MYDVVLFDLDGTLTDPKMGITKSIQYALSKVGIHEDNLERLVPFIGAPLVECLKNTYSLEESKGRQALKFFREYFSEFGIYENRLYPEIPGLLEHLTGNGKQLIVTTLKLTIFAKRVVEHFGIGGYFESIVGSCPEMLSPSKGEIIRLALSRVRTSKERVVMVGDREHDIIGARNNGIQSIGVTYGYGSLQELQNAHPTHLANSIEELKLLIN